MTDYFIYSKFRYLVSNKVEKLLKMSEEVEYQVVKSAVERGDNRAKTKLAWYKLSGYGGVEIDEDYAVALLEERVKDKDEEAMWMLGLCYEYGMGCEQDLERAGKLYQDSSENGSVIGKLLSENGKDSRGSGKMVLKGKTKFYLFIYLFIENRDNMNRKY